ncbi:MAG: hypothetical protein N2749_01980 [Clostridia bacterium]|nr:hypothetical protein [Clostridia bacterium]
MDKFERFFMETVAGRIILILLFVVAFFGMPIIIGILDILINK